MRVLAMLSDQVRRARHTFRFPIARRLEGALLR